MDNSSPDLLKQANFDHSANPMWVFDIATLAFLAVNEAAVRHYGYSRDQFLAMTILDIRPSDDVIPLLRAELQEGRHNSNAEPWRHIRKDGTVIKVEITSREILFQERRAEIVTAVDVTRRASKR